MDTSIETLLFFLAVIWFLMITLIFVFIVKVGKGKDDVNDIGKRVDNSEKKLKDLKSKMALK